MARFKTSLEKMLAANIRQMNKFVEFAENEALKSVQKDSDKVEEKERERIFDGKTFTGENITPSYKPYTVMVKEQKGQPTDRVTLKDTGDFHRSIKFEVSKTITQLTATDDKTAKLEAKYANILGLSESTDVFIITNIINRVNPKLFKKLLQPRYL